MNKQRPTLGMLLAFFVFEFVIVVITLSLLQVAGLEAYAAGAGGTMGGVAAVLGSLVFWKPQRKDSKPEM
jgi:hypothetical protein